MIKLVLFSDFCQSIEGYVTYLPFIWCNCPEFWYPKIKIVVLAISKSAFYKSLPPPPECLSPSFRVLIPNKRFLIAMKLSVPRAEAPNQYSVLEIRYTFYSLALVAVSQMCITAALKPPGDVYHSVINPWKVQTHPYAWCEWPSPQYKSNAWCQVLPALQKQAG